MAVRAQRHWRLAVVLITLMVACTAWLASPSRAHASVVPLRLRALRWAEAQAGKPYIWGGTGPYGFDCSGLVFEAYRHAGITNLGRDTFEMLAQAGSVLIRVSVPERGDLAFYGSGHVELVTRTGTFGALEPGTLIGWHHPNAWWHPTAYYRVK